jgi:hypothetical protein
MRSLPIGTQKQKGMVLAGGNELLRAAGAGLSRVRLHGTQAGEFSRRKPRDTDRPIKYPPAKAGGFGYGAASSLSDLASSKSSKFLSL